MLKNHLKTILRRATRDRMNTVINLFGLSVAIACCIVIFLFVNNELRYDLFHSDADNIYRITTHEMSEDGIKRDFANSFMAYAPLLESKLSFPNETVRMLPQSVSIGNPENTSVFQESRFFYVDPNFFDVFTFPLVLGDKATALEAPNNILITEATAQKYFGDEPVLGKTLQVEETHVFNVVGVIADLPEQSSLEFDFIVPMKAAETIIGSWIADLSNTWYYPPVYSFIKFSAKVKSQDIVQNIKALEPDILPENVARTRSHSIQNLKEIHFSDLENQLHPTIKKSVLYLFVGVGIVILLIAAFNFINLFLAKIVLHLKTVGIQKVLGAQNSNIWRQTLLESLAFLFISLLIAVGWSALFLPAFNAIMGTQLELIPVLTNGLILYIIALLLLISLLISAIPLLVISKFKPIAFLKGKGESIFRGKKTSSVQSSLLVFQFVIAVILIISTVIMQSQLQYIKNKNLGIQQNQILVIPVRDDAIQNSFATVKDKVLAINGVNAISAISNFPWEKGFYDFNTTVKHKGEVIRSNANTLMVDESIIPTLDMTVVKGRGFSTEHGTDSTMAFVMNETAAAKFGIEDIENVEITMLGISSSGQKKGNLIGVVKDFHIQSLHEEIQPLILTISPETYFTDNILVQLSGTNITETLVQIEKEIKAFAPNRPFEFFFLDEAFERLYLRESLIGSLFKYFSTIAILIACLGLLAITTLTTAQRLKEIGIRKVLGSSTQGIVRLLTSGFLKLVLVAIAIATPIGWWMMNKWLEDFAYKTTIHWWVFASAGSTALLIAMITVGWQSFKAASTNPVEVLRSE